MNAAPGRPIAGDGRGRRGVTLVSALVAMFILVAGMTIILQTYGAGAKGGRLTAQRSAATVALEAQLETLKAGGYARLPGVGVYPMPPNALPALENASGRIAVAPGPAANTRQVTASLTWGRDRPHREELAMVIGKWGMNP